MTSKIVSNKVVPDLGNPIKKIGSSRLSSFFSVCQSLTFRLLKYLLRKLFDLDLGEEILD